MLVAAFGRIKRGKKRVQDFGATFLAHSLDPVDMVFGGKQKRHPGIGMRHADRVPVFKDRAAQIDVLIADEVMPGLAAL